MSLIKLAAFREHTEEEKTRLHEYNKASLKKRLPIVMASGALGGLLGQRTSAKSWKGSAPAIAALGVGLGTLVGHAMVQHRLSKKGNKFKAFDTVVNRLKARKDPHDNSIVWF